MEVVYFLVVLAIAITGLIAWAFLWSVRTGQFDDLEGPAHRILHEDDGPDIAPNQTTLTPNTVRRL